jgi:hypothetical protein
MYNFENRVHWLLFIYFFVSDAIKIEFVHKAYVEKCQTFDKNIHHSNGYVSDGSCEGDEIYEGACKSESTNDSETIRAVFPDLSEEFTRKILQRYNVTDAIIMLTEGEFSEIK